MSVVTAFLGFALISSGVQLDADIVVLLQSFSLYCISYLLGLLSFSFYTVFSCVCDYRATGRAWVHNATVAYSVSES